MDSDTTVTEAYSERHRFFTMDAGSAAAVKKQKERTTKKAKQEAIVNSVKMLVLVPKRTTFVFTLTCSDDDSKDFYSWLNKGHNNTDFLVEKGLVDPAKQKSTHRFIKFSKRKEEQHAKCNQANILMAFLAARQLGMKDYGVFDGVLRFTYFDNFLSCLRNKVELCDLISAHFNLIVLGPDSDIRKAGKEGNAAVQQIHQFCGYDLLRARVFTYPPLSFAYFFEDKLKRDEVFETLKLPFVYINVTDCAAESAEIAFNELKKKYPDNEHVLKIPECGIVAKTIDNHCALGVYILQKSEGTGSCWKITCDNRHPFVPPQTRMRFEPFMTELKQSETRIYAVLIPGQKVSLHYKVKTRFSPEGLTLDQVAVLCGNTSRDTAERKLIKDAYDLFCTTFPSSIDAVTHLTLRFDVFYSSGKLYLNEVDVIPGAYLFLDDYVGTRLYLTKLSDTMATYIRNKWALWPA